MFFYSVIIPVFNRPKKIVRCVNSVLSQTFENFEIIIIDDGSTDSTNEIINNLEKENDKIISIRLNKNYGVIFSRNEGIKKSKGDVICFLDSDDIWYKDMLHTINNYYISGATAVSTGFNIVDEYSNKKVNEVKYKLNDVSWVDLLSQNKANCLTGSHKNIFKHIKFKNYMREDFVYWLDIARETKIRCIPNILAEYRIHSKSRSASKWSMLLFQWSVYRNYLNLKNYVAIYHIILWIVKGIKRYKSIF